ncbi:MAG: hypothetical protein FIA94_14890 [Nitrospirae bacterium]|nr:hypothetical protein [Nitrospirota bacterium]
MKKLVMFLIVPVLMGGIVYSGAVFAEHTGPGKYNNEDLEKVEKPAKAGGETAPNVSDKPIQQSPDLEGGRLRESVATQKRINRYFHNVVVPNLKDCWEKVQGKGTIEMRYWYEADAKGGWAFKLLKGGRSTLPEDQTEVALGCMQKAVAATSFPKDGDMSDSFSINWTWPVPLPPDADQQAARMLGSNGGEGTGCDGHGSSARCVTCSGHPQTCIYVCVGSDTCEVSATRPGGFDSICTEGGSCASGGPFGVMGGIMMY